MEGKKKRRSLGHTSNKMSCEVCASKKSAKDNKKLDKMMKKVELDYRKVVQNKVERQKAHISELERKKILDAKCK